MTYLDADLFFYERPQVIFQNQPDASVLLSRGILSFQALIQRK